MRNIIVKHVECVCAWRKDSININCSKRGFDKGTWIEPLAELWSLGSFPSTHEQKR